jgi:hypothetical protein
MFDKIVFFSYRIVWLFFLRYCQPIRRYWNFSLILFDGYKISAGIYLIFRNTICELFAFRK